MKTKLIIFERPNSGSIIKQATITGEALREVNGSTYSGFGIEVQPALQKNVLARNNPFVYPVNPDANIYTRPGNVYFSKGYSSAGIEIDLYDNIPIPITFTILDIREPEKRKTSWSKTIKIPGTKTNNRVFSHIYDIGGDAWVKIGDKSVWSAFNPNLKTEVILLNDGVQVMKGNMQLKNIIKDSVGNIEYEIALNGDLTSLFFDVGNKKLSDLDFSEFSHTWTKENIELTWSGISPTSDGSYINNTTTATGKDISAIYKDPTSGRFAFTTTTTHGYSIGDWLLISGDVSAISQQEPFKAAVGTWVVTDVPTTTKVVLNYFYPKIFSGATQSPSNFKSYKTTATGKGYVYPMISWGDEYDFNSFPVTSFVPGFFVKQILDKVFEETNSSYESDFFDSQFFKRLILIQKKQGYEQSTEALSRRKFWVGTNNYYFNVASAGNVSPNFTSYPKFLVAGSQSKTNPDMWPNPISVTNYPTRMPFRVETGGTSTQSFYDSSGLWNQDTNSWTVTEAGEYRVSTSFRLNIKCEMNGYEGGASADGTASFSPSTKTYFPGGSTTFTNPQNQNGLVITAKIKRKRNGQNMPDLATYTQNVFMNRSHSYDTTRDRLKGYSTGHWKGFGIYQPESWENIQINLTGSSPYFAKGDEVWVELSWSVNAGKSSNALTVSGRNMAISFNEVPSTGAKKDIRGEWLLQVESGAYIFNEPSQKVSEGSFVDANAFIPKDLSCKDFLLSIIKSFNLHIAGDREIERKYYIEPRDEFYYTGSNGASDYADWTDKVDNDSVTITPVGELISKYYVFSNKEESDFWNKKFKEERGRAYSYYNKEILNDFLKDSTDIEVPLGTTIMINNPEGSDVVMPAILQRESNGSFKPLSSSAPRMLIWSGIKPYTMQRGGSFIQLQNPDIQNGLGWEMLSSTIQSGASSSQYYYYPYAGTVDSAQDPYYDINWFNMEDDDFVYWDSARWTNNNLYNAYWSNFINEISDPASKVIQAKVYLTPADIYNLDFRKIYIIDGNYLRLQKVVDYDPMADGLTTCEFLKLKSVSKFSKKWIVVDDFGTYDRIFEPDTTPIIYNFGYQPDKAPVKRSTEFGFTNVLSGSSLSNNNTINVNGLGNFVATSAKNIKVNGNENAVGDSTKNVNISSGNGNFVSGGVSNVNIIGTDKRFIAESDVTYINNVRFKNGSPISKSNVIDGSIDVAMNRQSDNTTSNVISASEDVVIDAGSLTFENVIDSGADRILPDLSDLGVGTSVTPNPRTNSIGGFETLAVTQSLTEVIRNRIIFRQT